MALLTRKQQYYFALEDIEGQAKTLGTSDAFLALEPRSKPNKNMIRRDTVQTTLSREKTVVGRVNTGFQYGIDFRGGGSLATRPVWGNHLRACGFRETTDGITYLLTDSSGVVSAIAAGDVITGVTSTETATAIWAMPTASGATKVFVRNVSGAFQTGEEIRVSGTKVGDLDATTASDTGGWLYKPDSITASAINYSGSAGTPQVDEIFLGATSGAAYIYRSDDGIDTLIATHVHGTPHAVASETLVGLQSAAGFTVENPTGEALIYTPSATIEHRTEHYGRVGYGCRGNVVFRLVTGEPARIDFDMQGGVSSDGNADLATGLAYPNVALLRFAAGRVSAGPIKHPVASMEVDMRNEVAMRADPNAQSGDVGAHIGGRTPQVTFDPEQLHPDVRDWIKDWQDEQTRNLHVALGTAEGNRVAIYVPSFQIQDLTDQDRDGIRAAGLTAELIRNNVDGDDEIEIYAA